MKLRVWKKKAFRWMKKVMIPKMRAAEFARGWIKGKFGR